MEAQQGLGRVNASDCSGHSRTKPTISLNTSHEESLKLKSKSWSPSPLGL
jgi:hypothetical protein